MIMSQTLPVSLHNTHRVRVRPGSWRTESMRVTHVNGKGQVPVLLPSPGSRALVKRILPGLSRERGGGWDVGGRVLKCRWSLRGRLGSGSEGHVWSEK